MGLILDMNIIKPESWICIFIPVCLLFIHSFHLIIYLENDKSTFLFFDDKVKKKLFKVSLGYWWDLFSLVYVWWFIYIFIFAKKVFSQTYMHLITFIYKNILNSYVNKGEGWYIVKASIRDSFSIVSTL